MTARPPGFVNRESRVAGIWLWLTLTAVAGCFLPGAFGLDPANAGFPVILLLALVAFVGGLCVLVYWRRAVLLDRLVTGDVVVHWTYAEDEWQRYVEADFQAEARQRRRMFFVAAGVCLAIGLGFLVWAGDGGVMVFGFMVGAILLLAATAFVAPRARRRRLRRGPREVYLAPTGVYVATCFHPWNTMGGRLDGIAPLAGPPVMIQLMYSYPSKNGRQSHTVRVPVPAGLDGAAEKIAGVLGRRS